MSIENALPIFFPFTLVLFQFETLFRLRVLATDGTPIVRFLVPRVSLVISGVVSVSVAVSVVIVAVAVAAAAAAVAVAVAVSVVDVVVASFCTQRCCELSILFDQLADLILLFLYDF